MSRQINLPINQVRLTNVAVVRMNRNGKRFEIACYRNKVVNYRQGLETDLSEVLQTDRIFHNVSKGQFAKASDLQEVFGTRDEQAVAKTILDKGTLQVSDLERSQQLENMLREVATWVANNCVHPTSQRPYTVPQIREAMREAEFAVHPTRSVKRQYLDCVKVLQQKNVLPIERAKMKLLLVYPLDQEETVQGQLKELNIVAVETTKASNECQVEVLVDPSLYRELDSLAKNTNGRLEILKQVVRQEGDVNLELEIQRKKQQSALEESDRLTPLELEIQRKKQQSALEESERLTAQVAQGLHISDDSDEPQNTQSMRQNQKKVQKKSKKAKRREKEEAAERQARIAAEKQRQEERGTIVQEQTAAGEDKGSQGESKSCNTCGGSFATANAYRAHFRSDWHRYNMKLKLKGNAPVSEQEFLLCDSDAFFHDM